ncbi:MAG: hypothetical protein BJ554DRAFT_4833, partial [Olpidium bornovanus]
LRASEVREFFGRFGVRIDFTVAYNLEANGKAERGHQTLMSALVKMAKFEAAAWVDVFPFALWADRCTTHRTTGFAPIELMHGNRPSLPIEEAVMTWAALPWKDDLTREELLELRIQQLLRRGENKEEAIRTMREFPATGTYRFRELDSTELKDRAAAKCLKLFKKRGGALEIDGTVQEPTEGEVSAGEVEGAADE